MVSVLEQQPVGVGVPEESGQQSHLSEIPRSPDAQKIETEQGLTGYVTPTDDTAQDLKDDEGELLLEARIPTTAELSLPEKDLKPVRWHHFRAGIEKAIIWISETLLRRNKMQAKENIPTPVEGE